MTTKLIYVRKKDEPLYEQVIAFCEAHDVSLSSVIATSLKDYIGRKND